jgi:hypothetical protein
LPLNFCAAKIIRENGSRVMGADTHKETLGFQAAELPEAFPDQQHQD